MNTPTNGPKNTPQPRPANPAPITPPSRKTRPVVQSLQVLSMYAALVAVVCLLVTCSPATAQTIAQPSQPGYAGPARESDGQTLAGLKKKGAQPHHAVFLCAPFAYAHVMAGLGGDTCKGVPDAFLSGRPTRPSPVTLLHWPQVAGLQSIKKGAAHHG